MALDLTPEDQDILLSVAKRAGIPVVNLWGIDYFAEGKTAVLDYKLMLRISRLRARSNQHVRLLQLTAGVW